MSETKTENVQDNVQELVTENQNKSVSSNQDNDLLREVMQKKERLQKAESRLAELEKKLEDDRNANLAKKEEWKTLYQEAKTENDQMRPKLDYYKAQDDKAVEKMLSDFPEEKREVFKGMSRPQLEVVHSELFSKPSQVLVDNSQPTNNGGYKDMAEWAALDPKGYEKANNAQTSGEIKIAYGE